MWFEPKIPPDEEPAVLDIFLRYTIANIHGLLGTVIVAVLSFAAAYVFSGVAFQISVALIVLVSVTLIWLSGYFLWKAEREARLAGQLNLQIAKDEFAKELDSSRPKLVCKELQRVYSEWRGRKHVKGSANELLGTEVRMFISVCSVTPIPTQILEFQLSITDGAETYSAIAFPIKDGSIERTDPFKDLVSFFANQSMMLTQGEYFEGQVAFKVEGLVDRGDKGWFFDKEFKMTLIDSYDHVHTVSGGGRWMYKKATHVQ